MKKNTEPKEGPVLHYRFGVRAKILIGLTLFNILVTAIFTTNQHRSEKSRIMEGLEQKLLASATALPRMLPEGYLDRAVHSLAISADEYQEMVDQLSEYTEQNNLLYLYTYLYHEGMFWCTSTNGTPEELAAGTVTPYFDPYFEAPDAIHRAVRENTPVYDVVTDRWGTFLTLFYPKETTEGLTYVAGVDVDIAFVDSLLMASLQRSILMGTLAFLLILGLSAIASARFSVAIKKLAAYTGEFTSSNFSADKDSPLRLEVMRLPRKHSDEIGSLAGAFLVMEDRLAEYLKDLTETTAIKERIENEIKLAGTIQMDMLPKSFDPGPHEDRITLEAAIKPAREVGGDLYDYFFIDEEHLCVVIGDVAGKGMPAALFMTVAITALRTEAGDGDVAYPEQILQKTNNFLSHYNETSNFVTLFLGILNVRSGVLTFSDGGHNRPYLCRSGSLPEMIEPEGGTALGAFPDLTYHRQTLQMNPGDSLILYTDGVTEAFGPGNTFYGETRFEENLRRLIDRGDDSSLVDPLLEDIETFAGEEDQSDDITILVLRFKKDPDAS